MTTQREKDIQYAISNHDADLYDSSIFADGAAYARKAIAKRLEALRAEVLEVNATDQGIVLWDAIGNISRELESE